MTHEFNLGAHKDYFLKEMQRNYISNAKSSNVTVTYHCKHKATIKVFHSE